MKDNIRGVYLKFITYYGEYDIPFKNFEQLDEYTIQFENKQDLISKLFGSYAYLVKNVQIISVTPNTRNQNKKMKDIVTEIKFASDNYDDANLKIVFRKFLEHNPSQIYNDKFHINFSVNGSRLNDETGRYNDKERMEYAINNIWSKKEYKHIRDIYFLLKKFGCKIKINPIKTKKHTSIPVNEQIRQINPANSYQEYLQGFAKQGEVEQEFVMEQLSMFDLDELNKINGPTDASFNAEALDSLLDHIETLSKDKRNKLAQEVLNIRDSLRHADGKKRCLK